MDFISILLTAIGWQKDHNDKIGAHRTEAFRLNSEVAADAMQCVNLLAFRTPGILRRSQLLLSNEPEAYKSCVETLTTIRTQAEQIYAMAESYKPQIEQASKWADWEKILRDLHEWRATAAALCPYAETVLVQYEDALAAMEAGRR